MSHQEKNQRLLEEGHRQSNDMVAAIGNDLLASFGDLEVGVLANIFGFLPVENLMCSRRINKKSREAVKMTIVPPTDFVVDNVQKYENMRVMTRVMPNLQQINLRSFGGVIILVEPGYGQKYDDGEDPDEDYAREHADWISHDIEIISSFSKLRIFEIYNAGLNGRYPFLFNSFPLLQKLSIYHCRHLKFDLEMLSGFPLLKEFYSDSNDHLTGNISSLRVLKDTLEKVTIRDCENVVGNFMDLANFPHLKELNLSGTAVTTGDIRDIGENDFSMLEYLRLPKRVYGGVAYELQRISDAPDLVRTVYNLIKERPAMKMEAEGLYGMLSRDSLDRYESAGDDDDTLPFYIHFVEAGSRIGYRWCTMLGKPCEMNWLDPEPDRESSDYEEYIEKLRLIESEVDFYRGFHQPPTEEEYHRLLEEYSERDEGSEESDNYDY